MLSFEDMRLTVALALLSACSLCAWDAAGHKLVAVAAFRKMDAPARDRLLKLLEIHPKFACWTAGLALDDGRAARDRRLLAAIQEAAVWPDYIKQLGSADRGFPPHCYGNPERQGPSAYHDGGNRYTDPAIAGRNIGYSDREMHKYWHFENIPLAINGSSAEQHPADAINIVERIQTFTRTISADGDLHRKSYAAVWLLHLMGDIHQPLHCVTRFDGSTSGDDAGGNRVSVVSSHGPTNLHSMWDHLTEHIMLSDLQDPPNGAVAIDDPRKWAMESFTLARDQAYGQMPPDRKLSAGYETAALATARRQVSLAGSRLAKLF